MIRGIPTLWASACHPKRRKGGLLGSPMMEIKRALVLRAVDGLPNLKRPRGKGAPIHS